MTAEQVASANTKYEVQETQNMRCKNIWDRMCKKSSDLLREEA
jgi:hypothetical protein